MKPNNEIQTIPSCGNCKKVKKLEAEIKKLEVYISWIENKAFKEIKNLEEYISWIENKAFEYEDEAYRLRKQLRHILFMKDTLLR